jgi:hypothetical protein
LKLRYIKRTQYEWYYKMIRELYTKYLAYISSYIFSANIKTNLWYQSPKLYYVLTSTPHIKTTWRNRQEDLNNIEYRQRSIDNLIEVMLGQHGAFNWRNLNCIYIYAKRSKSSEMFGTLFPTDLRNAVPLSEGKDCKLSNNKANQSQRNRKEKTSSIKSINSKVLSILHQNIRGLRKKTDELISSLHPNFPHMLCITEHHMNQQELEHIHIENYDLGASYLFIYLFIYSCIHLVTLVTRDFRKKVTEHKMCVLIFFTIFISNILILRTIQGYVIINILTQTHSPAHVILTATRNSVPIRMDTCTRRV